MGTVSVSLRHLMPKAGREIAQEAELVKPHLDARFLLSLRLLQVRVQVWVDGLG